MLGDDRPFPSSVVRRPSSSLDIEPRWEGDEAGDEITAAILDAADATPTVLQEVAEQTTYGEFFLSDLIRRQRRLSLSVAGVFLAMLFGLPLVNIAFPALAELPILGLPLSWVLLAVAIYPLLWALALYFTTTARALEDEFINLVK